MLSRTDGFVLYGKLGVDFSSTSELRYANIKNRLRLIRARHNVYMASDNHTVSLEIVDCSLYIRRIALRDDFHKKRQDRFAYTPVEFNYPEIPAKTFITPARQNHFIQKNVFNNAPVRRIAFPMNTNTAFTRSYTENPVWYQQFDLTQSRKLRGGQPNVDSGAADNCHLYVTTLKARNFQMISPQFRLIISKTTMC